MNVNYVRFVSPQSRDVGLETLCKTTYKSVCLLIKCVWDVPFVAVCCLLVCRGGSLHVPEQLIWVAAWHGKAVVGGELAWT